MEKLQLGYKFKSGLGHVKETISNNNISVVFSKCRIENILDKLNGYHNHCLQVAIKTDRCIIPFENNKYSLMALKNITLSFFHSFAINNMFSITFNSIFIESELNFIQHTIIVPEMNTQTILIEKL